MVKNKQCFYYAYLHSKQAGGKKSKCVAAKGCLQGWAATLLLLCVGLFHSSILIFH